MSAETGHTAAPTVARLETYAALGEFTLHLIQAMLRTGYYAADHPEAQKSLSGLYPQFQALMGDRPELTYLVTKQRDQRYIAVEGYDEEAHSLQQVMIKGMADLFTPKFLEFFDRWKLLSFSIGAEATPEEFEAFVEMMSQPPMAAHGTETAADRLRQAFADRNIIHISAVFDHDIVGRDRKLPWRVKMALSRLQRDLSMLPLYKRASSEQLRRIKLQIIDDVIRPMRTPPLLKDFLLNCDLVAADIGLLEETQVEREIVENLSETMLVETARLIVDELESPTADLPGRSADDRSHGVTRQLSVLRDIADRLCHMGSDLEHDFLESLIAQKVLSIEDLPPDVRSTVETRRIADIFTERADDYLGFLAAARDAEQVRHLSAVVKRIWPELLHRRDYATMARIVTAIDDAAAGPALQHLKSALASALHDPETVLELLEDLHYSEDKSVRHDLVELLVLAGPAAAPALLEAYAASDTPAFRSSAFEVMSRLGPPALEPFLLRLPKIEPDWAAVHHIVAAVGASGDPALAEPLIRFMHHSNVHVRESAVTALYKLLGPDAESHLLAALQDTEGSVRLLAVTYLGEIGSRHPGALEFYRHSLAPEDESSPAEDDPVLVKACENLARWTDDDRREAEAILLAALRPPGRTGLLAWLKKPSPRHSARVRTAVLEALGSVGSPEALETLYTMAERAEGDLAREAAAAADRIGERSTREAVSRSG